MKHQLRSQIIKAVFLVSLVPFKVTAQEEVDVGRQVYEERCSHCHGMEGKGDGAAAQFLKPKPRDFTRGLFKVRSTMSGLLPTDADLFRTVSEGMPGTSMPGWSEILNDEEIRGVIAHIKTFSKRFARLKEPPAVIHIGERIAPSPESLEIGRGLFEDLECWKCHGWDGHGDGMSAPTLVDDWENPIGPTDLTRPWNFRGGGSDEDIFRTFVTGFSGAPMPSYGEVFETPEEAGEMNWHLVNYVATLAPTKQKPEIKSVMLSERIYGEIPLDASDASWELAEAYSYPLVGQVIQKSKLFTPSIDLVTIRSLRNDADIGFLIEWFDGSESHPEMDSVLAGQDSVVRAGQDSIVLADALALQYPVLIPDGPAKPHFLMGDARNPVNLWTWSAADPSVVTEANARGMDKIVPQGESGVVGQDVGAQGDYERGRYRVVMKRSLTTMGAGADIQFEEGRFIPIAFHAWDGANGETGSRHAVSSWYLLYLAPPRSVRSFALPSVLMVLAVVMEFWFVRRIRKNGIG